ncbi:MAG: hypothetical protein R3C56_20495 [Pirellulaceae bacterium]
MIYFQAFTFGGGYPWRFPAKLPQVLRHPIVTIGERYQYLGPSIVDIFTFARRPLCGSQSLSGQAVATIAGKSVTNISGPPFSTTSPGRRATRIEAAMPNIRPPDFCAPTGLPYLSREPARHPRPRTIERIYPPCNWSANLRQDSLGPPSPLHPDLRSVTTFYLAVIDQKNIPAIPLPRANQLVTSGKSRSSYAARHVSLKRNSLARFWCVRALLDCGAELHERIKRHFLIAAHLLTMLRCGFRLWQSMLANLATARAAR